MIRKIFVSIWEIFEIAVVTIGAVLLIRGYLIQPFLVSGSSMLPNFSNGDYLLIDELTLRFRTPSRGEVIVFHYPKDESTYFIKRVIGLPGERVVISQGHVVVYNQENPDGFILAESYLPTSTVTDHPVEVTLKNDEYFVLGDNRSFSFDSRSWGVLKSKEIVGIARLRLWPLDSMHAFAAPQY